MGESFEFVKSYNEHADKKFSNWVGLFKRGTDKYVVKHLKFKFKNLKYYQLRHEAEVLQTLAKIKPSEVNGFRITFPQLYSLIEKNDSITLIRHYVSGTSITELPIEEQKVILDAYIKGMRLINSQTIDSSIDLPRIHNNRYATLFFVYIIQSIIKDWKNLKMYLSLGFDFYKNYLLRKKQAKLCFAHRDLHDNNILVSGKNIYVIDLEVSEFTEEETDLAIIARYYLPTLGIQKISELIKSNLSTRQMKHNFNFLTIFYSIQLIASEKLNDFYSIQANEYLQVFLNSISLLS